MRCPFCGNEDTAVKDSRTTDDHSAIRRRRFCAECGSRFTTFERIQLRELFVVKKSGRRVPFDRDKLTRSIEMALHKRTITPDRIEKVVTSLVRQLETSGDLEVSTSTIGEMVMQALINLDAVAYIRFASVYHEFSDVKDFVDFISQMTTDHKGQEEE